MGVPFLEVLGAQMVVDLMEKCVVDEAGDLCLGSCIIDAFWRFNTMPLEANSHRWGVGLYGPMVRELQVGDDRGI